MKEKRQEQPVIRLVFVGGVGLKTAFQLLAKKSFRGKEGGTETKLRAAIYVRVSTEEQAVHGYSLAEQREACSQRAAELGAVEILLFADEGASGATLDRPGLDALREAVRMGTVNTLVLRDPDRLSRRLAHQLYLSEEFEKAGVQLEFLDFEWKTTPEGRLFYAIKGAIAEYEREKIRERVTRGKLQKARQGGIPVNFDVYGYRYDTETGEVSLYDEEAIFLRRLDEGDEEARNILIEHNLRLVAHIIKKFDGVGEDADDLISIGTIGLIKAINTFNTDRGTKLATYAARCIENEILMTRSPGKMWQSGVPRL
jgi:DNA invertase Pin-like site-specific DNA recombinase